MLLLPSFKRIQREQSTNPTFSISSSRHPRSHLRHRLFRSHPHGRGPTRTAPHHQRPRNEGQSASGICQQAGSQRGYVTSRPIHKEGLWLMFFSLSPQQCHLRKSPTLSSSPSSRTRSGMSYPAVPPVVRVCWKVWLGSPTTSRPLLPPSRNKENNKTIHTLRALVSFRKTTTFNGNLSMMHTTPGARLRIAPPH